MFGAGGDGDIVLKSNDCTVSNGAGSAARSSNSVIVDERGDQVCIRTGSVWEMKGDWYTKSLEVDNSVAATTLITSGSRLFVQGTLTIDSSCIIHNDGGDGDDGADSQIQIIQQVDLVLVEQIHQQSQVQVDRVMH